MKVLKIIPETMADGPGLRTSVYVAGCAHRCKGCHNPQSWDFNQGDEYEPRELAYILIENKYTDITFSGGDPIYQIKDLIDTCKYIKELSNKNIWVYTGFTREELESIPEYSELKKYIDSIVVGPFIQELKDPSLKFMGSSNQEIININK
jgi:anaerobic ribonucleoside-triphosphate reductase activating protein